METKPIRTYKTAWDKVFDGEITMLLASGLSNHLIYNWSKDYG